jgi:hypothetical protein
MFTRTGIIVLGDLGYSTFEYFKSALHGQILYIGRDVFGHVSVCS